MSQHADPLCAALLDVVHRGQLGVTYNCNGSGLLWERLWKWTPELGYQAKVFAPGLFGDWHTFETEGVFCSDFVRDAMEFRYRFADGR